MNRNSRRGRRPPHAHNSPNKAVPRAHTKNRRGATGAYRSNVSRAEIRINQFPASDVQLYELEHCLSIPRMRTYLLAAEDDLGSALNLYNWNTAVSAAF